jgi:hypothetical protein
LVYGALRDERFLDSAGLSRGSAVLRCPANPPDERQTLPDGDFDFVVSASLHAHPRYFSDPDPEEWRLRSGYAPQFVSSAAFPGQKVGVFEAEVWHGWGEVDLVPGQNVDSLEYFRSLRPGSVWFLDGHATLLHARDALPYVNRYPIWPIMPFGTTVNGIAGRDSR